MKEHLKDIYEGCGCMVFLLAILLVLGIAFGVYCLFGWIFMLLWNWIAVGYFSAPILGYWVCVGITFALNFIGNLLFKRGRSSDD